jgi:hypothetical protein
MDAVVSHSDDQARRVDSININDTAKTQLRGLAMLRAQRNVPGVS